MVKIDLKIVRKTKSQAVSAITLALLMVLALSTTSPFFTTSVSGLGQASAILAETNSKYSLGTKGNQIFYFEGYWFLFYFNGSNTVCNDGAILYKTSADGEIWSDPSIAVDDPNVSAYFSVYQFNETVVVAYSSMPPTDPNHDSVVSTKKGTISLNTILWDTPVVLLSGHEIGRTIGNFWGDYAFGEHWLAVEYLYEDYDYNCKIFSTTDFNTWNLSKDWQTNTEGYVFTVTLKYVENSKLIALYGSWLSDEFNYMFYDGSNWSVEYQTSGAGLASGSYKAQCEVVVNGTMYMLYSLWDYVTSLKLAVYNGSWYFSDFLPGEHYWGGDSSATLDPSTGMIYFFYIDNDTNEVLAAYSTNYVDWYKDVELFGTTFDTPRWTRTLEYSNGSAAVAWMEGSNPPFQIKFNVASAPRPSELPTLTISLDSSTTYIGYNVKISGELTYPNGTQISGANLLLSYSVTGGESWSDITSITTSDGGYYVEWEPTATGNYLVKVGFSGNETMYLTGTEVTSTLAVMPVEGEYVFSVVSNSTVSELAFNSTSRVLDFIVSGPTGTTGYTKVTMEKTLISDINDLKVYIDGSQTNYTATLTDTSLVLFFTYQHSTHQVVVSLGAASFIPPQIITPLSLIALALGLAVATTIIALRIRKRTWTTTSTNNRKIKTTNHSTIAH